MIWKSLFIAFFSPYLLLLAASEAITIPTHQDHYIEHTLTNLFLNEFSKFSASQQHWLEEQEVTIQDIERKASKEHRIQHEYVKLQELSYSFRSRPISVHPQKPYIRKLQTPPLLPFSCNQVVAPYQRYIVCNAPRTHTLHDFWNTVLTQKAKLIITLVTPDAEDKEDCLSYWKSTFFPKTIDEWTLSSTLSKLLTKDTDHKQPHIILRSFLAHNNTTQEDRIIYHLHYAHWKDNDRPQIHLLEHLISLAIQLNPEKTTPIVVHCAGGIGRAGTFVTTHSLCKELWDRKNEFHPKNTILNIPQRVLLLRLQRPRLVATPSQYLSIYQTIERFAGTQKKGSIVLKKKTLLHKRLK